jgi:hypothetical protein
MATYSDYVKDDNLTGEINDAAAQSRARDEQTGQFVPERFAGKTINDVIQSYEELEKLNSRQAQDLGEMRKTVDQLITLQSQQAASPEPEATAAKVTVDELYEDPDNAVRRVAKDIASKEVTAVQQELAQLRQERKLAELDQKFPGWKEKATSPEFVNWVNESPYRARMAADADRGDFDAAEEVLGMYYDYTQEQEQETEEVMTRQQQLHSAVLESSTPAAPMLDTVYSRNELLDMRLAAKNGDQKAQRWMQTHSDAIALAYEEGRIVD